MRILVTGSRTWTDEALMWSTFCREIYSVLDHHTLIHGGARGADEMAGAEADKFGWSVEVYPADWEQYGKRAGYVRNAEMVAKGADICLAFIHNDSRGATMCADLAEKAGIKTVRIIVHD